MTHLITLLTERYLRQAVGQRTMAGMITISFVTIALTTMALVLIISIISGFHKVTREKLKGIHADVLINSHSQQLDLNLINNFIAAHSDTIKSWSVHKTTQALIGNPKKSSLMPFPLLIKGVDHLTEGKTSSLESLIIKKKHQETILADLLKDKSIIIGSELAEKLNLSLGDSVTLYFAYEQPHNTLLHLDTAQAYVSGIFKTGIDEFDSSLCYIALNFFDELFEQDLLNATLKLHDDISPELFVKQWQKEIPYSLMSWQELYPALASALLLEKYATLLVLILITTVASMTIIALMFMLISYKKHDIAILQSMGCSTLTIRLIFLAISSCITLPALITGLIGGGLTGVILKKYVPIHLPDTYYATQLPVDLNPYFFVGIGTVVFIVALLAALIPLFSLRSKDISPLLRS